MSLKEEKILENYLLTKGLKQSHQRVDVLRVFLDTEGHHTPEEIHLLVKKKYPEIGIATVYRTLKVLCECKLARELLFDGKIMRYEHSFNHSHHDHLICTKCGTVIEVVDETIEKLQEKMAKKHDFTIERHRMEIYGICGDCKK